MCPNIPNNIDKYYNRRYNITKVIKRGFHNALILLERPTIKSQALFEKIFLIKIRIVNKQILEEKSTGNIW